MKESEAIRLLEEVRLGREPALPAPKSLADKEKEAERLLDQVRKEGYIEVPALPAPATQERSRKKEKPLYATHPNIWALKQLVLESVKPYAYGAAKGFQSFMQFLDDFATIISEVTGWEKGGLFEKLAKYVEAPESFKPKTLQEKVIAGLMSVPYEVMKLYVAGGKSPLVGMIVSGAVHGARREGVKGAVKGAIEGAVQAGLFKTVEALPEVAGVTRPVAQKLIRATGMAGLFGGLAGYYGEPLEDIVAQAGVGGLLGAIAPVAPEGIRLSELAKRQMEYEARGIPYRVYYIERPEETAEPAGPLPVYERPYREGLVEVVERKPERIIAGETREYGLKEAEPVETYRPPEVKVTRIGERKIYRIEKPAYRIVEQKPSVVYEKPYREGTVKATPSGLLVSYGAPERKIELERKEKPVEVEVPPRPTKVVHIFPEIQEIIDKAHSLSKDQFREYWLDKIEQLRRKDIDRYRSVLDYFKTLVGKDELLAPSNIQDAVRGIDKTIYRNDTVTVKALRSDILDRIDDEAKKVIKSLADFTKEKYPKHQLKVTIGPQPIAVAGRKSFRITVPDLDFPLDELFPAWPEIVPALKELEQKGISRRALATAQEWFHELGHTRGIADEVEADKFSLKMIKEWAKEELAKVKSKPVEAETEEIEFLPAKAERVGDLYDVEKSGKNKWKIVPESEEVNQLLSWAYNEIKESRAGRRIRTEAGEWIAEGSTFPEWFKNKGYTKKEVLIALDKARNGLPLTAKQLAIAEDALEYYFDLAKKMEASYEKERLLREDKERIIKEIEDYFEEEAKKLGIGKEELRSEAEKVFDQVVEDFDFEKGEFIRKPTEEELLKLEEPTPEEIVSVGKARGVYKTVKGEHRYVFPEEGIKPPTEGEQISFIARKGEQEDLFDRVKKIEAPEEVPAGEWEKVKNYTKIKKGDYIRVKYKDKEYEGEVIGERAVKLKSGFVGRQILTPEGKKVFAPWTPKAEYWRKAKKPSEVTLGFLGLQQIYESIASAAKKLPELAKPVKIRLSELKRGWQILFEPWALSAEAKKAEEIIRYWKAWGELKKQRYFEKTYPQRHKLYEKLPEDQALELLMAYEEGRPLPKELKELIKPEIAMLDRAYELSSLYDDLYYTENYVPHIFTDSRKAREVIDAVIRRKGLPKEAFARHRVFSLIREAMEYDPSLKLKTTNFAELVRIRYFSAIDAAVKGLIIREAIKRGILATQKMADDWIPFRTPAGDVWGTPEVVRMIDRAFQRTIYGRPDIFGELARLFLQAKNVAINVKLGIINLFHFWLVNLAHVPTEIINAMRFIKAGDIKGSIKQIGIALSTPITVPIEGYKLRKILIEGPKNAREAKMVYLWLKGGGRVSMPAEWSARAYEAYRKALKDFDLTKPTEYPAFIWELAKTVAQSLGKPLMGIYIPNFKLGAWKLGMEAYVRSHPEATLEELAEYSRRFMDSLDNRLGEMVYDNMHWIRWMRDIGVLMMLSLGWQLGNIREFGGAVRDVIEFVKRLATKDFKGFYSDRLIWATIYPVLIGSIGYWLHKVMTGKDPETVLDCFYPWTGLYDTEGRKVRIVIPGYHKDYFSIREALQKYGLAKGTAEVVSHKTAPLLNWLYDILFTNKDFYGVELRNPDDPVLKQVAQVIESFMEYQEPIFYAGYKRVEERVPHAPAWLKAMPLFGISLAPVYIEQTDIQKDIAKEFERKMKRILTEEEWKRLRARAELRRKFQMGELTYGDLREAVKEGLFGKGRIADIKRSLTLFFRYAKLPTDIRQFRFLDSEQQDKIVEKIWKEKDLQSFYRYYPHMHLAVRKKWHKIWSDWYKEWKKQQKEAVNE